MRTKELVEKYVHPEQKQPSWVSRWKPRTALLFALLLPGVIHMLDKRHFRSGCFLCLFGIGALITLAIGVLISNSMLLAFDIIYATTVPNLESLYPLSISSSADPSKALLPIQPEGKPIFIQPFYWEMLYGCILLYVVCAGISFWLEWKQKSV